MALLGLLLFLIDSKRVLQQGVRLGQVLARSFLKPEFAFAPIGEWLLGDFGRIEDPETWATFGPGWSGSGFVLGFVGMRAGRLGDEEGAGAIAGSLGWGG